MPCHAVPCFALRALETLMTEMARVRLHGFSQREFSNAVKNMQVGLAVVCCGGQRPVVMEPVVCGTTPLHLLSWHVGLFVFALVVQLNR